MNSEKMKLLDRIIWFMWTKPRKGGFLYKSRKGKDKCIAVYEAALANWPVPCEQLNLPTHCNSTHIISSLIAQCDFLGYPTQIPLTGFASRQSSPLLDSPQALPITWLYEKDIASQSKAVRNHLVGPAGLEPATSGLWVINPSPLIFTPFRRSVYKCEHWVEK